MLFFSISAQENTLDFDLFFNLILLFYYQQVLHFWENNVNKTSVMFLGLSVVFPAFFADFCLCRKSVIVTTLTP